MYRKILGRSTQIGCRWFAFFREECREKGIGVAMGGFVRRKKLVVPVRRMMRCPMVEENTCLKVVGVLCNNSCTFVKVSTVEHGVLHSRVSWRLQCFVGWVLVLGWCVGLGPISTSRQIGQLGMGFY